MKKIVLTGGGTAGHVSPNLALIPRLLQEGYEIDYIGTEKGIEREMIARVPQVHYHAVKSWQAAPVTFPGRILPIPSGWWPVRCSPPGLWAS